MGLHAHFQDLSFKREFLWRLKIEGFLQKEDALPSSHAPEVFHTNPSSGFFHA